MNKSYGGTLHKVTWKANVLRDLELKQNVIFNIGYHGHEFTVASDDFHTNHHGESLKDAIANLFEYADEIQKLKELLLKLQQEMDGNEDIQQDISEI